MVVVGLTGGAIAVETVFAVPGIGRTALGAAKSQDLPLLQGSVLALLVLGLTAGALAALVRRRLLGRGLRDARLTLPAPPPLRTGLLLPAALAAVLLAVIGWGLLRDPYGVDTAARLAAPSLGHPLGTDGLGRDVLARLGHGAAATAGTAAAVCALSFVAATALGFVPNAAAGMSDIANALPPVITGILVAAVVGPGPGGAALAVALISWPPLAAHAAALVQEVRASGFLLAQQAMGASPAWILTRHVLPSVAGPVASRWRWPPSASSGWAPNRPPRSGGCCWRSHAPIWSGPPGRPSPLPWRSPRWPRWRCPWPRTRGRPAPVPPPAPGRP
jgi:peptide/nickel transport system permease protein